MAAPQERMADLEDGELDSDSDTGAQDTPVNRAQGRAAVSLSGYRCYRSSSDSGSDCEQDVLRPQKRVKRPEAMALPPAVLAPPPACGRKVNNIWGSVVQEQSQDAVMAELGIMGMDGGVSMSSRQSETYNYVLAQKLMEREREAQLEERRQALDEQMDMWANGTDGALKRKRAVKDRLGPRAEMDLTTDFGVGEDDPEEKVIDVITQRLMEPKKDLMERVVQVIGRKKALELLSETATIEQNGGLKTVDGSRRRTPGGVYLNLLKNTPGISRRQLKKIFLEENRRETGHKKAAKARRNHVVAKKMKQALNTLNLQEQEDESRETFASDTEEALCSLEEAPGGPTEDGPALYSSTDLEVF